MIIKSKISYPSYSFLTNMNKLWKLGKIYVKEG